MEFEKINLDTMQPKEICSKCAESGLVHLPTETAILYCAHSRTGAYLPTGSGRWMIVPDIDAETFREMVARGLTMGELRGDLRSKLETKH